MSSPTLPELEREARMGARGTALVRDIPEIDLTDFAARKAEVTEALWQAATACGFFQLVNHGIPLDQIETAFATTERFFALAQEAKAALPLAPGTNAGWEYMAQIRPSTGERDRKESYQITLPRMAALWPELAGFKATMLAFERANWAVGMQVLSCFATRLGFAEDFFTEAHDPLGAGYQSTLRLLHYLPLNDDENPEEVWRAGPHTDFDCLTLLHQQPGQGGLQICPGAEAESLAWTDVEPKPGVITCNIGDMLMRWSDDELRSTLHRVVVPENGARSSRYSLAFFCQANTDTLIESPRGTYEAMTADAYLKQRVAANRL